VVTKPAACANLMNGAFSEMGVAYAVHSKSKMALGSRNRATA